MGECGIIGIDINSCQFGTAFKRIFAHADHISGNRHTGQACAAGKGTTQNMGHTCREGDFGERCAVAESTVGNVGDSGRNGHIFQAGTAAEHISINRRKITGQSHTSQACTVHKIVAAHFGNIVGNGDISQTAALAKGTLTRFSQRVRKCDRRQGRASPECPVANLGHTIGNGYRGQVGTLIKCVTADGGDAAFHHNLCNGIAVIIPWQAGVGIALLHGPAARNSQHACIGQCPGYIRTISAAVSICSLLGNFRQSLFHGFGLLCSSGLRDSRFLRNGFFRNCFFRCRRGGFFHGFRFHCRFGHCFRGFRRSSFLGDCGLLNLLCMDVLLFHCKCLCREHRDHHGQAQKRSNQSFQHGRYLHIRYLFYYTWKTLPFQCRSPAFSQQNPPGIPEGLSFFASHQLI